MKKDAINWNPSLINQAKDLQKLINNANQNDLHIELQKQLIDQYTNVLNALDNMNNQHFERTMPNMDIVWNQGSTNLYSYPAHGNSTESPILFFIPSLMNRSYIFDLSQRYSMLRYLQQQGIQSYVLDWGEPNLDEKEMDISDYIIQRSEAALHFIAKQSSKPIGLVGYCMGGIMALPLAQRNPQIINGLALFATPWDFHSEDFARIKLAENDITLLAEHIKKEGIVTASTIQSMFYYLHPSLIDNKVAKFIDLSSDTNQVMDDFIALESWINDGISLTHKVARECLIDWTHNNILMNKEWILNATRIDPGDIEIPVLFVQAQKDKIVPKNCSQPLIDVTKNKHVIRPTTGHLSTIAGKHAQQQVWQPLCSWSKSLTNK